MAEGRPKKIAVIGATGLSHHSPEAQVECFRWNRLKKLTNLADYDVVVLDLLSIEAPDSLDVTTFRGIFDAHTVQQVLSKTNGVIFVYGDPRFAVEWESAQGEHREAFLDWTGLEFQWDGRPGTTVEWRPFAATGSFKRFADKLASFREGRIGYRRWAVRTGRVSPSVEDRYDHDVDELIG